MTFDDPVYCSICGRSVLDPLDGSVNALLTIDFGKGKSAVDALYPHLSGHVWQICYYCRAHELNEAQRKVTKVLGYPWQMAMPNLFQMGS